MHGGAGGERIDGDTRQPRELRRPRGDIAQHRRHIRPSVGPHVDECRRRHCAVGGIDHDAERREGKLMLVGDAGDDM